MSGPVLLSEVLQWVLLVAIAWAVVTLLALYSAVNERLAPAAGPLIPRHGLAIGAAAPGLKGSEQRSGRSIRLSDYAGQRLALLFLSPSCGPCVELIPHINELASDDEGVPVIVVAQSGDGVDYGQELAQRVAVVDDRDQAISKAFKARQTPLMYVIDKEGRIANRTMPKDVRDLEDTLAGLGRPQGNAPWVPRHTEVGGSRESESSNGERKEA